jgi:hypothetical protein
LYETGGCVYVIERRQELKGGSSGLFEDFVPVEPGGYCVDEILVIIFGEEFKLRSSLLRSFLSASVTSSAICLSVLVNILFLVHLN